MSEARLSALQSTLDQLQVVLSGLPQGSGGWPTPCRSWDVDRLLHHLVSQVLSQFAVTAGGGSADWSSPQPRLSGDWAEEARMRGGNLMDAWAAAPAERFGVLDQQLAELTTHTWDLARATGQAVTLDPDAAERGLAWARGMLKVSHRGEEAEGRVFGPEVRVAAEAPAADRLVAWFGRDPAWEPPGGEISRGGSGQRR